jgi:hypothetical protein
MDCWLPADQPEQRSSHRSHLDINQRSMSLKRLFESEHRLVGLYVLDPACPKISFGADERLPF